ncbi:MAG: DUF3144 domain-containing protein [Hyphomonadaceae bacterium]|jgi:Protein of unknown function (DUF3144)
MAVTFDDAFYDRVEAHIHLSNDQKTTAGPEGTNASMMYASARFNAWLSAARFESAEAMAAKKKETIDFFLAGYRDLLEGNIDDYIKNFDRFMKPKA